MSPPLSTDSDYEHLPHHHEQIIRIVDDLVMIIDPVTGTHSSFSLPREFQCEGTFRMIHCNGLLLSILPSCTMGLWNPCLNEVRLIESDTFDPADVCTCFGFGYDGNKYKILMFDNWAFQKTADPETGSNYQAVSIYNCNSGTWKSVQVLVDWHVIYLSPGVLFRGVSVKKMIYWIVEPNLKSASSHSVHIQSFDLSSETFSPSISLPVVDYRLWDTLALSSLRGDTFSLLHKNHQTHILEVWVTENLMHSWTKVSSFKLDLPFSLSPSLGLLTGVKNSLIVFCDQQLGSGKSKTLAFNLYHIEEGEKNIRKIEVDDALQITVWPRLSNSVYIPSLVPVPVPEDRP